MGQRWALYIDIEGFGVLYDRETAVIEALGDLMEGIYAIGTKFYPESPDRLFAHQTGDGFVIVSEFDSASLEVPASIAIALLRHIAARGRFAKASIGEGKFGDIWGYYPEIVRRVRLPDDRVPLGGGLMTIFPVMGTALINAVGVAKRSPSGSLLTIAKHKVSRLPEQCDLCNVDNPDIVSIDWIHSELPLVVRLQRTSGLRSPSSEVVEAAFWRYSRQQQPPRRWVDSTAALLGLATKPS